jgi:hypothetical protein
MTDSNQSGKARHVMRTRVLRRPIVFFGVRCSICFRCSILHLWLILMLCWKYMLRNLRTYLRLEQHKGQNDNTGLANESFGNVTECKYLGTAVTSKNCIHQEINIRVNSRDSIKRSFFFFLGPVCISSGSTAAFKAYCALKRSLKYTSL